MKKIILILLTVNGFLLAVSIWITAFNPVLEVSSEYFRFEGDGYYWHCVSDYPNLCYSPNKIINE